MRELFAWIQKHERHLSASAMLAGFIFDNLFFNRIDEAITHLVFISYLVIAALAIAYSHYLEEHSIEGVRRPAWRSILPIATQFALGGLWSGFLIFFSRSATLAASWPFLLILGAIFVGNEYFKRYHDRLTFTAVLYFFALYSYAIFTAPLLTHAIGTGTFILSGVAAVVLFGLFMLLLRFVGRFRFARSVWQIRFASGLLFIVINVFYFINILPPLPLALSAGGIYHSITRSGDAYIAEREEQPWYVPLWAAPTLHVSAQGPLYAFSAVFAPIALSTEVVHEWQRYNDAKSAWDTHLSVSFAIAGGREGGYRGFTKVENAESGSWRVNIKTVDGRLIGRLTFKVAGGGSASTTSIQL